MDMYICLSLSLSLYIYMHMFMWAGRCRGRWMAVTCSFSVCCSFGVHCASCRPSEASSVSLSMERAGTVKGGAKLSFLIQPSHVQSGSSVKENVLVNYQRRYRNSHLWSLSCTFFLFIIIIVMFLHPQSLSFHLVFFGSSS